jgi:arsenate reductase (glutaredoxin)
MNIQIFGTKKCSETRKAERYFKERNIPYHFRDLNEKGVSKGELDNISAVIPLDDLIDTEGKEYKKQNLQYIKHDVETVLLENALLFKTPIVRNGRNATLGNRPEIWKTWS